jgi:hypothetical protein
MLNDANSKYYAPSEHLALDEVTVLFKERGNFQTMHTQETNILE